MLNGITATKDLGTDLYKYFTIPVGGAGDYDIDVRVFVNGSLTILSTMYAIVKHDGTGTTDGTIVGPLITTGTISITSGGFTVLPASIVGANLSTGFSSLVSNHVVVSLNDGDCISVVNADTLFDLVTSSMSSGFGMNTVSAFISIRSID